VNGATEPVRQRLAHLGWSVPVRTQSQTSAEKVTRIYFAELNSGAARALARTLPFPSRLTACSSECQGLRLVIGTDFLEWMRHSKQTLARNADTLGVRSF
jgi:hypothetical protein